MFMMIRLKINVNACGVFSCIRILEPAVLAIIFGIQAPPFSPGKQVLPLNENIHGL